MSKLRISVLIVLWICLLVRVVMLIQRNGYDTSYLTTLAIFAWLGGLVTRTLYDVLRELWEERGSYERT